MSAEKRTNPNGKPTKPQRDAQGRFVKGNDGGPGNPFGRHLARARCKWNSLATPDHVENVYKAVYEKAIDGCVAAMKLYLLYLLGKPNPMPNPDHVDLEEYELYENATRMMKRSPDVMTSPDHSFALEVARTARPAIAEESRKQMLERFREAEEEKREIDEQIKQMEEEYDRQQAKKRRSSAKRGKRRALKKQRRANAKRQAQRSTQAKAQAADGPSVENRFQNRDPLPNGFFGDSDLNSGHPAPLENRKSPHRPPSHNGKTPHRPPLPNGFFDDEEAQSDDR